jgi:putative addiction module component (TIGR02574 family)
MNSRAASIFDLSPSEKLQLVEDLWDDLSATPEAVPVHDWQKQELARRKVNLLKNPAAMAVELVVAPEAEQDIVELRIVLPPRADCPPIFG